MAWGLIHGWRWNAFIRWKREDMETITKKDIMTEFRLHAKDTGSADVQVALLTNHINHLSSHLQKNVKDHSSRRGLLRMVSLRRRLLDYLHLNNNERYQSLIKKLKLRK